LQAHGFTNAVSPVAASLSNDQLDILERLKIKRVILVPDNDKGGSNGTKRNIVELFNRDIQPLVIERIPNVKDVNDLYLKEGSVKATETFNNLIKQSKHGLTWFVDELIKPMFDGTDLSKLAILDKASSIKSKLHNSDSIYFDIFFKEPLKQLLNK
jgi:DNA primase